MKIIQLLMFVESQDSLFIKSRTGKRNKWYCWYSLYWSNEISVIS